MMLIVAGLATAALLTIIVIAAVNFATFPRLRRASDLPDPAPALSVLIPARNEAHQIGATVSRLLRQSWPGPLEILVLDDESSDGTAEAARAAGAESAGRESAGRESAGADKARLRVLRGKPLPPGWAGKVWACHQLADAATGDLLLFTDADVIWEPGALAAVVAARQEADLLTVWPTQEMESWSERLVVPLMSFAVLAYLPVAWVHRLPHKEAAAANGQCLLFTRAAYGACGGHRAVAGRVLDDVLLARAVKAGGGRLRMADGNGLLRARMYTTWPQVRDGYAKSILAGHGGSPALLLSTLLHLILFVLPWLWLAVGGGAGWPLLPLALGALGIGARAITAATARQPLLDALWMPLSVLLMTRIALQALWWRARAGGPRWKDRVLLGG